MFVLSMASTNAIPQLVSFFQVDLPIQQSFLWYASSTGDSEDSQVLCETRTFSIAKHIIHIFDRFSYLRLITGIRSIYFQTK